jgi:hypothetical protein
VNVQFSFGSGGAGYTWNRQQRAATSRQTRETVEMTRTFLISSAIAAVIGFTAVPASANDIYIKQYGFANSTGGSQTGFRNRTGIHQNGRYNTAISTQKGKRNMVAIGQDGRNNDADVYQRGNLNSAGVGQFGALGAGDRRAVAWTDRAS